VWFGVVILGVSLYKFISAFWTEASPWPELQLGAAGLIVVAAGRGFRNSAFITTLLSENSPSARARRSFLILALASFIMSCVVLLKLSVQDIYRYKRLLGEGGILEYLQALILFASTWISWLISKDLRKRLFMRLHSVVYAIISFVMLFVGLEEIAWGQILFGWKTPENIAAVNAQNQTTLHNLEFFQNYLDLNLFLVSVALLVLVLWRPSIRWRRTTALDGGRIPNSKFFIPRYFWPLFFCAAFLSYFVATESGTELVINIDQEWAEFLLYLAAGLNLLRTYILLGDAQPQPTH
ncbi:MAG: pectate lyase, partial [Cyanobacteriota bacterium]|nr:pectate lyase [Cyanobacteriota bacterium]